MAGSADRLRNLFPSLILRSPFHRLMSGRYMIIEFTGRRTGQVYATPVAYVREGNRVLVSSNHRWWRNLVGGAPVRLHLQGRSVTATATPVTDDPDAAAAIVRTLVDAIPSYAGLAGMAKVDGRVPDSEVAAAVARDRVAIEIRLEEGA